MKSESFPRRVICEREIKFRPFLTTTPFWLIGLWNQWAYLIINDTLPSVKYSTWKQHPAIPTPRTVLHSVWCAQALWVLLGGELTITHGVNCSDGRGFHIINTINSNNSNHIMISVMGWRLPNEIVLDVAGVRVCVCVCAYISGWKIIAYKPQCITHNSITLIFMIVSLNNIIRGVQNE